MAVMRVWSSRGAAQRFPLHSRLLVLHDQLPLVLALACAVRRIRLFFVVSGRPQLGGEPSLSEGCCVQGYSGAGRVPHL